MSLAGGDVLVSDGWSVGMHWRWESRTTSLCLLRDSDPLQRAEIRHIAPVERREKCGLCIGALKQEQGDKEGEREQQKQREKKKTRWPSESKKAAQRNMRPLRLSPPVLCLSGSTPTCFLPPSPHPNPHVSPISSPCSGRWSHTQVEQ